MDYVNASASRSARAALVRKVRGWIEEALGPRDDLDGNGDDVSAGAAGAAGGEARGATRKRGNGTLLNAADDSTSPDSDSDSDSDSDDGLHGYTVLVQEMTCNIPGCAPIETVVAMLKRGANRNGKILKPIAEVTEEDVAQLLVEMIGDPTGAAAATDGGGGGGGNSAAASSVLNTQEKRDDQAHPFLCPCCNPEVTKFDKMLMFGPGLDHI
jgi:hypothetical protein